MEKKFYICEHCGNIIDKVYDAGVPVMCCGQKMKEIVPGVVEASAEKHVPVITVQGNLVKVEVGSAAHPMTEAHSIQWVYLQTDKGGQYKYLAPQAAPEAVFGLYNEEPVAAYAYCNLHGLWKADVEKVCDAGEASKSKFENYIVCKCKNVSYVDIVSALDAHSSLDDVLKVFEGVKDTTHCSTGCGGCYDKVIDIISDSLMGDHR